MNVPVKAIVGEWGKFFGRDFEGGLNRIDEGAETSWFYADKLYRRVLPRWDRSSHPAVFWPFGFRF